MSLTSAGPPSMNWRIGRVGLSQGGAARIADEFRVEVDQLGQLTPSAVRAQSQLAKDLKQQVVLAQQYQKASEAVIQSKVKIEGLRGDLLAKGLEGAKAVDHLVSRAQLQTGQYLQSLQTTAHSNQLDLQAIARTGQQDRERLSTQFAAKAQQARQLQVAKLQQIDTDTQRDTQTKLTEARRAAEVRDRQRQEAQALKQYIKAEDYTPSTAKAPSAWGRILNLVS
jgi:hypothetical protein